MCSLINILYESQSKKIGFNACVVTDWTGKSSTTLFTHAFSPVSTEKCSNIKLLLVYIILLKNSS